MMKVLRALPGEERQIELKPWLYRIAHNESIDLLRRRRETRELDTEQVAVGRGLTEDVATRERLRRLFADLAELPERQREVLVMRELSGLDFGEIGAALETSDAVARQTLYEARQSLRQMEEGREMSCETVMRALSDGDGRVIRRRDVRAHLRSCAECRGFRDEIKSRKGDFAALSPLPAVAAAGMLQGLLGGGGGAAGGGGVAAALGGGAAKTIGTSAAAKGVATVAAVAAVGVTAADRTGVIHVLPGEGGGAKSSTPAPGASGAGEGQRGGSQGGAVGGADKSDKRSQGVDRSDEGGGAKKGAPSSPAVETRPTGKGQGKEGQHASSHQESNAQGPPAHAPAHGHEKQPAAPAEEGLETAGENKPPVVAPEPATDADGGSAPVTPPKPATPSPPESTPGAPPKEPSASPPSQAPQQQQQSPPQSKAEPPANPAPAPGQGKGKGVETLPESGS
jgi:RNA polymerase sigma factor (sigma-70 family)